MKTSLYCWVCNEYLVIDLFMFLIQIQLVAGSFSSLQLLALIGLQVFIAVFLVLGTLNALKRIAEEQAFQELRKRMQAMKEEEKACPMLPRP